MWGLLEKGGSAQPNQVNKGIEDNEGGGPKKEQKFPGSLGPVGGGGSRGEKKRRQKMK